MKRSFPYKSRFSEFLFLLFVLYFTACTSTPKRDFNFIALPETINKDPNKTLSSSEVEYDLSQAIYALETAYSGKRFLPKGEFHALMKNLEGIRGGDSVLNFCEKMDRYLDAVSDSHLSAKFNDENCYKSPGKRKPSVGKNFYAEKNGTPWNVRLEKKNRKSALLISITGFPPSTSPAWAGFIESVQHHLPKANLIIIDMRGNGGGDDTTGYELSALLAGSELKTPYAKQWSNTTPEAQQLFVNTFEHWARIVQEEGKPVPSHLLDLKKTFIARREKALKGEMAAQSSGSYGQDFVLEKSARKPIYILIDADCASSCESTTDAFENNTLVKTVGENTAGYVHFGNSGGVILKNSGIRLQVAISYNSYLDGRFIEKVGITPKIPVPAGSDAKEYAWNDFFMKK